MEKHLENTKHYGVEAVVAINQFTSDTDEEIAIVKARCEQLGFKAVVADIWGEGGSGAMELATAVAETIESTTKSFKPLYDWSLPVKEKIETICKKVYGASGVDYSSRAVKDLRRIKKLGLEGLPVCIAKTQKSLSDDPAKIGRPTDLKLLFAKSKLQRGRDSLSQLLAI